MAFKVEEFAGEDAVGAGAMDGYDTGHQLTEWEEALMKHKIIPKLSKAKKQDEIDTERMWEAREHDDRELLTLEELEERGEDVDEMELIRRKRLAELKAADHRRRFGSVRRITKSEYESEVTNASKECTVILCMFAYGQEDSQLMLRYLEELAKKFSHIKFVKIQGQECVDGYPDAFCPTLIIYKDTNPVGHIKGLSAFGGKGVCNEKVIEWELAMLGIITSDLDDNPRKFKMKQIQRSDIPTDTVDDDSEDSLDID